MSKREGCVPFRPDEQVVARLSCHAWSLTSATFVPSRGCVEPEELTVALCQRVMAEVKAEIQALDQRLPILLSLDISANEDATGELRPHWSVPVHPQRDAQASAAFAKGGFAPR